MFPGITAYQIAVLTILFITMVTQIIIVTVVSSKYYSVKYVSKDEQDNLDMQEKVRRFVGELIFSNSSKKQIEKFIQEESNKEE